MTDLALITGASSGLGEEYAIQLSNKGYDLIITARREQKLQDLAKQIESRYGNSVTVIAADLATETGRGLLVETIKNTDNLNYLVNNAGFGLPSQFLETPIEKHVAMVDVHITAVVELSYAALDKFISQKQGTIITVASMAAFIGDGMYSGTKNFQIKFSKKLAKIGKNHNVRVQALCPGYVRTGFHYTDDYEGHDVNDRIPSWLWLEREDVVRYSLAKAENSKVVVIPSFKYKLAKFLSNFGIISKP